jgi:hypothetical protein
MLSKARKTFFMGDLGVLSFYRPPNLKLLPLIVSHFNQQRREFPLLIARQRRCRARR